MKSKYKKIRYFWLFIRLESQSYAKRYKTSFMWQKSWAKAFRITRILILAHEKRKHRKQTRMAFIMVNL